MNTSPRGYYADEGDWNEATDWADKAAEAGNVNGMYKTVNLHSMRMHSCIALGMFSGLMPDDARAVQNNAAVLIGAYQKGMIDLSSDIYSHLLSELRDGIYYEATSCYYTEPSDNNRMITPFSRFMELTMALVSLKLSGFASYFIQPDQVCQRFKV